MLDATKKVIVIGGSAGCITPLISLIGALPQSLKTPVIIVLHRLKNVSSEMDKLLSAHTSTKMVIEPNDKEPVKPGCIYLAPQNYHLLLESDYTFSLDYSEAIQYSRPSIDVTFESAAKVYGANVIAILLSGANSDGSNGITTILKKEGSAFIQDPLTAEYPFMPSNAAKQNAQAKVLSPDEIKNYLQTLE